MPRVPNALLSLRSLKLAVDSALAIQRKIRTFQEADQPRVLVRAPKKFAGPQHTGSMSISERQLPVSGDSDEISHSMLRITDDGGNPLSAVPVHLPSPESVFCSSERFSMDGWFKKKVRVRSLHDE